MDSSSDAVADGETSPITVRYWASARAAAGVGSDTLAGDRTAHPDRRRTPGGGAASRDPPAERARGVLRAGRRPARGQPGARRGHRPARTVRGVPAALRRRLSQRVSSARSRAAVMRAGPDPAAGGVGHQGLDPRVRRRRHAVQPAEQRDLPVQVVGLDAGPARQALPGRTTPSRRAGDRLEAQVAAAASVVLGLAHRVDPGGREDGLRLGGQQVQRGQRVVGVEAGAAERLDGVAEVVEQLAVLPAHDVRPRHRLAPRAA